MQYQSQLFSPQQQQGAQSQIPGQTQGLRFMTQGQQQQQQQPIGGPMNNGLGNQGGNMNNNGGGGNGSPSAGAGMVNGLPVGGSGGSQDAASSVQQPAEYTLAGILHYLQSEWRRYEKDRNEWEIERAEMRARIALLEGERRGAENLKTNLMRRVKMLEYALKQERSKLLSTSPSAATAKHPAIAGIEREASLTGSGRSTPARLDEVEHAGPRPASIAAASSLLSRQPSAAKDYRSRDKSREYLKQCLQEISYLTSTSTLNPLPERSSTMFGSAIVGGIPRPKKAMSEEVAAQTVGLAEGSVDNVAQTGQASSVDAQPSESSSTAAEMMRTSGSGQGWDKLASAGTPSLGLQDGGDVASVAATSEEESVARAKRLMRNLGALNSSGSNAGSSRESSVGMEDELLSQEANAASEESQRWKLKRLLTHHRAAVKSVAFDGADVTLVSASNDKTLRLVRLDASNASLKPIGDVVTLRGHSNVVTSVVVSTSRRRIFSASLDSTLNVWSLDQARATKSADQEAGADVDGDEHVLAPLASLKTESQIMSLALLPHPGSEDPKDAVLATASADGLVRLYRCCDETGEEPELLRSFDYFGADAAGEEVEKERESLRQETGGLPIATSICSVDSNQKDCAVAYSNAIVKTFRIDSGEQTAKLSVDQSYDGTPATQVNVVVAHPTLPLLLTGHEDKFLRIIDVFTGGLVSSLHAHTDAVTTLDIDPAGLRLLSGGHDGAVRIWDIAKLAAPFAGGSPAQKAVRKTKGAGQKADANGPASGDADASATSAEAGAEASSEGVEKAEQQGADAAADDDDNDDDDEEEETGGIDLFQELTDHTKLTSTGEGVLAVRYHQSLPYFATAGADGSVRIYG
ncbi:unnamed protein product [Parajaminaea phylloscopi]